MASQSAFDYSHLAIAERLQLVEERGDIIAADGDAEALAYSVVERDTRRAPLRRFPYSDLYLVDTERPFILACKHTRLPSRRRRQRVRRPQRMQQRTDRLNALRARDFLQPQLNIGVEDVEDGFGWRSAAGVRHA